MMRETHVLAAQNVSAIVFLFSTIQHSNRSIARRADETPSEYAQRLCLLLEQSGQNDNTSKEIIAKLTDIYQKDRYNDNSYKEKYENIEDELLFVVKKLKNYK